MRMPKLTPLPMVACLTLAASAAAVAQQSIQVYELSPESDPTVFSVVETWSNTEISVTSPVTDIDLTLSLWGEDGAILEALAAPNGLSGNEWKWEWLSADIDVVADGRLFRQGWGQCTPWENDLTHCQMDGDGGTFLIEREISDEEFRFHLIMRLSPDQIEMNAEYGTDIRPAINVFWPEDAYGANMVLPTGTEGRVTFIYRRF